MFFHKMQSNGNDYIYIILFDQTLKNPSRASKILSDRHFGIGSDGLVLIERSETCDFLMRIFDPDGTEANICGNALQSAGALFYDSGHTAKTVLSVETHSGVSIVHLGDHLSDGQSVSVDVAEPSVEFLDQVISVSDRIFSLSSLSLGNPHCVVFVEDLSDAVFLRYAPKLEMHSLFPNRANVEFAKIIDRSRIQMRTWERGCGETLSCSTGSATAVVASHLTGRTNKNVTVEQAGGNIRIDWHRENKTVRIFSKTQTVFTGQFDEKELLRQ